MYWNKKKKNKDEKKHKYNAKEVIIDGIKFPSTREGRMYSMLKKFKVPFEMQVHFEVQPKFQDSQGNNIRSIYMLIDFVVPYKGIYLYIDVKGVVTPAATLKFKMLKYKLKQQGNRDKVFLPSTNKEVDDLVIKISNQLI
jgi:hypothetical protein